MIKTINGEYLFDRNRFINGREPLIFHCHHYNCFLQYSIENTRAYIDVDTILTEAAQEVVFSHFATVFAENKDLTQTEKTEIIENNHQFNGFGLIDLSQLNETGGTVNSTTNHYAEGWLSKFGKRNMSEPGACFFTSGYIAGALDALTGELGKHTARQTRCMSKGDAICQFEVVVNASLKQMEVSVGEGKYQPTVEFQSHADSPVDYPGIRGAVAGMPIQGDEKGLISAFGVLLTRMYANYYTLISYRFVNELEKNIGEEGRILGEELLVEAGHVCAFNTFGGIMESAEWYGLIFPTLQTREDWVHGIVAVINALGWGHYEIEELVPAEKLVLRVYSGYESNMYVAKYGEADEPIAHLNIGGVAGIMNLIYHGDITTKPELNEEYYDKIFKLPGRFLGQQTMSRTMGDEYDEFEATL